MIRRRRPPKEIAFSFDSFLDLVANVVGIILRLILVAWVGARPYKAAVPPPPPPPRRRGRRPPPAPRPRGAHRPPPATAGRRGGREAGVAPARPVGPAGEH